MSLRAQRGNLPTCADHVIASPFGFAQGRLRAAIGTDNREPTTDFSTTEHTEGTEQIINRQSSIINHQSKGFPLLWPTIPGRMRPNSEVVGSHELEGRKISSDAAGDRRGALPCRTTAAFPPQRVQPMTASEFYAHSLGGQSRLVFRCLECSPYHQVLTEVLHGHREGV